MEMLESRITNNMHVFEDVRPALRDRSLVHLAWLAYRKR